MGRIEKDIPQRGIWREHILTFVCVGSQKYRFDRLIKAVDELASKNVLDDVFIQTGHSSYIPAYCKSEKFICHNEFNEYMQKADLIITHGGTGVIVTASKLGKQIIAVPRKAEYKEHIDDHQFQIVDAFYEKEYIRKVVEMNELGKAVLELKKNPIKIFYDRTGNIPEIINEFIIKNI